MQGRGYSIVPNTGREGPVEIGGELPIRKLGSVDAEKALKGVHKREDTDPALPKVDLDEKILSTALCKKGLYENPIQLAIAMQGFEDWLHEKNIFPSAAALALYLNISKSTLYRLSKDKELFLTYVLIDKTYNEYVYSTTSKSKLEDYIDSHSIVLDDSYLLDDNSIIYNNIDSSNMNTGSSYISEQSKVKVKVNKNISKSLTLRAALSKGLFEVLETRTSFYTSLSEVLSFIEVYTISKGFNAKNPGMAIFMLKNSGGNTLEYADKKQVIVGDAKPYDSMTDDEIMNAVNERPSVD